LVISLIEFRNSFYTNLFFAALKIWEKLLLFPYQYDIKKRGYCYANIPFHAKFILWPVKTKIEPKFIGFLATGQLASILTS